MVNDNARSASTVVPPSEGRDYSTFPSKFYTDRCPRWYRCHKKCHSPYWFASADAPSSGRFDLPSPLGTLNAASSAETAASESRGQVILNNSNVPIPETACVGYKVSCIELPRITAADFTDPRALAWGIVSGDISGPLPGGYGVTQKWASKMHRSGFDGILSKSRFGGAGRKCIYYFGNSGENCPPRCGEITSESKTLKEVLVSMNFKIQDTPRDDELEII